MAAILFLRSLPTLRCSKTARRFRAHLSVLTSALVSRLHPCGLHQLPRLVTVHHPFRPLERRMATLDCDRLSAFTACSPSRCRRPRSSCDARVHSRFGVLPSSASTLSREDVPRRSSLRVHDQELLDRVHLLVSAVLAFRRSRATLRRLTVHGLASSCHVSTRASGDPLPFEDRARTSHPAVAPALIFRR
jgi:hypothetical protein